MDLRAHRSGQSDVSEGVPTEALEPARSCKGCHAERSRGISRYFLAAHRLNHGLKRRTLKAQHPNVQEPAGGGARTHTALRPLDFESSASANSATPALGI